MIRHLIAIAVTAAPALAQAADTRMLTQPAVSATHVAFIYSGDLWSARTDGTDLRRLTTADGDESSPVFSPDGQWIAFSGNYDGNTDVYVTRVGGGAPRRLTWHPGADIVRGFRPDGRAVLFASGREVHTNRYTQLFTVDLANGVESRLPLPNAAAGTYSPDGAFIVYNPLAPRFLQWKRYRGGTASELWVYDVKTHAVEEIPQPATRSNDVDPIWIGNTIYFRSDRDGEFNVHAYDTRTKRVTQVTRHRDFPVLGLTGTGNRLVYEQAGYLHNYDIPGGAARKLVFNVPTDFRELRPRIVKGANYVRNAALSPTGMRVAFEVRGEILTVPVEKGDPRNISNALGSHERSPAWSPNGANIAYVTDASGEYELRIVPQDGRATEPRTYKLAGHGFYEKLLWSPDSRKIAYADNSQAIYIFDVATGTSKLVAQNANYRPRGDELSSADWSPDSRWLAYTVNTHPLVNRLGVYSVDEGKNYTITDGLSEVTEPAFDESGRYLYVFASTNAGPIMDWFAQSTTDAQRVRNVYAIVLRNDTPNPFARESDEERVAAASPSTPPSGAAARPDTGARSAAADSAPRAARGSVRIDFEGIENRIVVVPAPAGDLSGLSTGESGILLFLRNADGRSSLHRYDLNRRRADVPLATLTSYAVSADGKKILYRNGQAWAVGTLAQLGPNDRQLAMADVEVKIDPAVEYKQIFDEAWRINRDFFYDPKMHGIDWPAMRAKYAEFLPHVSSRSDLNRVIQWMSSELSVGHHNSGGGDRLDQPAVVPGGLLGADYEAANGRYRFRKVYGGVNWNPALRAPLTEPGVNVRAGEYLLAVNGVDVRTDANLFSYFENTANKITEITVGPNPDRTGSRNVTVVPVADEGALRNRAWVEDNLRKVDSATGGRVAYVYVPNTAEPGFSYFKRYFYPQAHKDAIIVDERYNGGGQVADYYIDLLRRPLVSYWALRYGDDLRTPTAAILGPKALIIDETAGSGGDLFPYMWRKFDLGPIVGKRTWGGLVGILGYPTLMDGGSITAPNLAIWTPEDGYIVENEGVPPDIEVEQRPADVIAGKDPQLDRAIALVMEELRKRPPTAPKRPPPPVKRP